ncbi:YceK/YidQ family lipoprotein [Pseudomonas fontis]|uniref:YceK/YidQ family lipoprotein n=1 Tax=Pseudomonas fontis TaxID=2942633 RepID=A0ABT5NN96_9PSED|nr:YceK/YidQ family lipoprotein [Pseudomonas fontis]MDD0973218.1 YceK/YidQ family lipoprotein [Pseudomonas fontis]MDD0989650.1 YceK/YidQ family lipoprotein [Pseudomonas fontis]
MKLLLSALALLVVGGCSTVRTLDAAKPGAPVVYSGTRLNLYVMQGGCCPEDRFGVAAPAHPGLDLPGSALLDTLFLPLSLLTVLGVGFQATGGL